MDVGDRAVNGRVVRDAEDGAHERIQIDVLKRVPRVAMLERGTLGYENRMHLLPCVVPAVFSLYTSREINIDNGSNDDKTEIVYAISVCELRGRHNN